MVRPIRSFFEYYFPLYDQDNFDPIYSKDLISQDIKKPPPLKFTISKDQPVKYSITGRIYYKSKLIWFKHKSIKYPFKFELLIIDEKGYKVPVIFWNELALNYYYSIYIGDIISIKNYEIKRVSKNGLFYSSIEQDLEYEISCNSNKAEIIKAKYKRDYGILDYPLTLISKMEKGKLINFMGIVVNVGTLERCKDENGFFAFFRWITLVDYSSSSFFYCKLYSNSSLANLSEIKLGEFLFLTNIDINTMDIHLYGQSTFTTTISNEEDIMQIINYFNENDLEMKKIVNFFSIKFLG